MNPEERDAIRAALQRMYEENINPYRLVGEALARGAARERSEHESWSRFLPGHAGAMGTQEIAPLPDGMRITYAPDPDGIARPGEIVRTWIPRDESGRGVYDSVLIIGEDGIDRLFALRMSRTPRDGSRRLFDIGAGPKDSHGRFSWIDLEHLFSVHRGGMRRTGFVIDRPHFNRVADELYVRYGWRMED